MTVLRDYACECERRRCRERIYLTPAEYRRASTRGLVVVPEHARAGVVLETHRLRRYVLVRGGA